LTAPVDLPLFPRVSPEEGRPLRTPPARPPLAVRRATPEIRKARPEPLRTPLLDLVPQKAEPSPAPNRPEPTREVAQRNVVTALAPPAERTEEATVSQRVVAAAIDVALLAAIDALVIYFTLSICGLTLADLAVLPRVPLVAFLVTQNGAYLVAFTAGGQTLGKMATGIRVVSVDDRMSLNVARAALRAVVWALLAVPAGLGFLSTWLARDRRGLHDRCAGTRVVRAGAA
jgi:uncharacterized RDD family membrane protein YckC